MMPNPGDIVTLDFPGATGVKRRPAVVVSSDIYHQNRPDIILGVITSQVADATTPTDYILRDWTAAGLRRQSAFRAFLVTMPAAAATFIGRCTAYDWNAIQRCVSLALASTSAE